MRLLIALILAAALGGCERKASFDETYERRSAELTAIANGIEGDLNRQLNAGAPSSEAKAAPHSDRAAGP